MIRRWRRIRGRASSPVTLRGGFTLIELLVVVGVIALLLALLVPGLATAREQARTSVCGSNLHQLVMANIGYAAEHHGYLVPGAADLYSGFGGTMRWHGVRTADSVSSDEAANHFDPARGPLAGYLGKDGRVKQCPSFRHFVTDGELNAFESGGGGYGYNNIYVGSRQDLHGPGPLAAERSARLAEIRQPAATVMFTDTAFAQASPQPPGPPELLLIEYSFCEPPLVQAAAGPPGPFRASPSIHFRHRKRANAGWLDGHVDTRWMSFSGPAGFGAIPAARIEALGLGWFGPADNSLFDLK